MRANGSRERAPDDRLREAIQRQETVDASFAWLLAMKATENDREELDWRPLTCAA
jgi:hypothetical protein